MNFSHCNFTVVKLLLLLLGDQAQRHPLLLAMPSEPPFFSQHIFLRLAGLLTPFLLLKINSEMLLKQHSVRNNTQFAFGNVMFFCFFIRCFACVYVQNVDDDASIHDKLLWAVHMSGLDDLLKFLACAQSEQQWSFHILEIISLMFRDQVT